jgi:hypothetical protein
LEKKEEHVKKIVKKLTQRLPKATILVVLVAAQAITLKLPIEYLRKLVILTMK